MLRYLALGDSYTIGESVPESARWPVQLVAALRQQGLAMAEPELIATTGWTTDELAAAVSARDPQGPFDLVSLLIGVNNQYRGRPVAEFAIEFKQLLEHAVTLAGGRRERVIVLSIPDWGVTPFARAKGRDALEVARAIDAYNSQKQDICRQLAIPFISITDLTREAAADPTWLAEDGLHPSGADYARWAQRALPIALAALRQE